jgi:hypothetical protein
LGPELKPLTVSTGASDLQMFCTVPWLVIVYCYYWRLVRT